MFPTIAEYNQAIQSMSGGTFKSLTNISFIPSRTIPVRIYSYGAGSYAVVFKAKDQYNEFAIRCFISAEQENIERYRNIDNYLKDISASWITKIELLQNEINVKGNYYPVIKMDWVEGQLLNNYITEIVDNNLALSELQNEVVSVSKSLETLKIGHGDIQCGNIIIAKNIEGKNIIRLIDYDGMYIPSFSNKVNLERGRTEFQHPNRSQTQYNEKIDRFSFWVILCAIEALKYDNTLWFEVMRGGFNTLDNLLFVGDDFKYFNNSKLVNRLYALNKPSLSFYLNKLNKFCNSIPDTVDPPTIFDYSKQTIENIIPTSFPADNFEKEIEIITSPIGAAVLTQTFQRIGITPLKIDKEKYLGKTLVISYGTQFKQVPIQQETSFIDLNFNENQTSSTTNNQKHQINSPDQNHENIPILLARTAPQAKTENYGWKIFGILTLIIVAIAIIVSFNQQNDSSITQSDVKDLDSNPSYTTITNPNLDTTNFNNTPSLPKTSIDEIGAKKEIEEFISAENMRDFSKIYSHFSYNMESYYDINYPSYEQLYNRYQHSWNIIQNSKNVLKSIQKINENEFVYSTDFSYYNVRTKKFTFINNAQIKVVFDNNYKFVSLDEMSRNKFLVSNFSSGKYNIKNDIECEIVDGSLGIGELKNGDFQFALGVDGYISKDGWQMQGRIEGVATFIADNIGVFTTDDCKSLTFTFLSTNKIMVEEEECQNHHGVGICFNGIYEKE